MVAGGREDGRSPFRAVATKKEFNELINSLKTHAAYQRSSEDGLKTEGAAKIDLLGQELHKWSGQFKDSLEAKMDEKLRAAAIGGVPLQGHSDGQPAKAGRGILVTRDFRFPDMPDRCNLKLIKKWRHDRVHVLEVNRR